MNSAVAGGAEQASLRIRLYLRQQASSQVLNDALPEIAVRFVSGSKDGSVGRKIPEFEHKERRTPGVSEFHVIWHGSQSCQAIDF
jgi:hypothetical protein